MTPPKFLSGWLDALRATRDRRIASESFQRWSLSNPLTRPFARRKARQALDLCAGFVYSQILFACVELDLFALLLERPLTIKDAAAQLSLSEDAVRRLFDAAASLDLLEKRGGGRFGLGQIGAALAGNPAALSLIAHQPLLYADLKDPVALLRGGAPNGAIARYWPYSLDAERRHLSAEAVAPYSALMAASQPIVAAEALSVFSFGGRRRLMDVGGGEGVFLCAAAARAPHLQLALFDLPAVAERAKARFAAEGLAERAQSYGGDFLVDPLPEGADVISLVRIVHDHDDASALALLANVRRALPEEGALLIVEAMSGVKGAEPLDAYYGFYTLAMGRGEPRRADEIAALLRRAGFARSQLLPNANVALTSVMAAYVR
jgi:demethylspheroidene O-methyltransferase